MDAHSTLINAAAKERSMARISAIDRFRGLAIFCMIFFQLIAHFECFGILTRIASHNIDVGIVVFRSTTIADLIAPMFMFAIALTYKMSFDKRVATHGRKATNLHFLSRYLGLIGIGAILYTINVIIDHASDFGSLRIVDDIFIVLTLLSVLAALVTSFFLIKPFGKYKSIPSRIFTVLIALLGAVTIVVGFIDFIMITAQVSGYSTLNYWMVLQSLGWAGLLVLPIINFNLKIRSIIALTLVVIYTIYYNFLGGQTVVNAITQGGFVGGFGWAMLIALGSVFMELFAISKKAAYLATLGITIIAIAMYFALPIAKHGVRPDPTYLIVALALSCITFLLFDLTDFISIKFDPLSWWGRYPILLYLLEFAIIGLFIQLAPDAIVADAPLWLGILIVATFIVAFTLVVYFLSKKNKKVNL